MPTGWGTGAVDGDGTLTGGGGNPSSGTPAGGLPGGVYYPSDATTREFGTMLQVVSEGPIFGLVDGLKSVYLDGTPILSASGSKNFSGIALAITAGTNTQAMIPGFVDVESETPVNVRIKVATGPATRTISTPGISAIRVRLSVPTLKVINSTTGAESGASVQMKVERQSASYTPPGGLAGDWEVVPLEVDGWITGKFGSKYTKSFRVDTPAAGPWSIKITRLSPDNTGGAPDYIQDESWWDAYTEITDVKLRHPYSALAALRVDAKQFQSIPRLTMDLKGRIIKIPSNYNPTTRVYTGIWDGTFTDGWTNNPAWIWYDLATNTRYGAGSFLNAAKVDKWALYTIAQMCDELVSDGLGGTEPRFRCSVYLQNQADAIKVLQEMASIFRGMIYWAGSQVTAVQDVAASPVALFTNSNVKDGRFVYQGSARKSRHTAALVSWQDPNNGYETSIEYVEDHAAIARYGFNSTSISALGATSQAQARRLGLWTLLTETMDTEAVTFSAGLEGSTLRPGNIVGVQDQFRAAQGRFGGRVLAGASTTVIPLDGPTVLPAGTNTLSVRLPSGLVESRTVTTAAGTVSSLTVSPAFSAAPQTMAQWALNTTLYRVLGIKKGEGIYYDVTALQHTPSKYALIDAATVTQPPAGSIPSFPAPSSIVVSHVVRIERDKLVLTLSAYWTGSEGALYVAEASQDNGPWKPMEVNAATGTLEGVTPGVWRVRVQSVFSGGVSAWSVSNYTIPAPSVTGTDAGTAVNGVNQINSVDYLSPQDKIQLRRDWDSEQAIKTKLDTQAGTLGVSATAYDNAVAALSANLITAGAPSNWATIWPDGIAFNVTGIVTSLRGWWSSVATERAALQKACQDAIQNNAAYADSLARSSNNLIKNANSENVNPTGPEAAGVVAYGQRTGSKCRTLVGTGGTPQLDITPLIPCSPGDQFYLEAWGYRTSTGSGNARVYMVFLQADRTTVAGYTSIEAITTGYQKYTCSLAAPAAACFVLARIENDSVPNLVECYWDDFYMARKVSAGVLESDLGIFGVIRSGGGAGTGDYVAGSTGNAPQGFKLSGVPFTSTLKDGSTFSAQAEFGSDLNVAGERLGSVVDRAMNRFAEFTTGSGSWLCPPKVYEVEVTMVGAGAGGVKSASGGAGGGAGATIRKKIATTPGTSYPWSIGTGGAGSTTITGNAGGNTTMFSITAQGGQAPTSSGTVGGVGGSVDGIPGNGAGLASTITAGFTRVLVAPGAGGGGSSASGGNCGTFLGGGNGGTAGGGAASGFGNGGVGNSAASGDPGGGYGAGGGGTTTGTKGGDGIGGYISIRY